MDNTVFRYSCALYCRHSNDDKLLGESQRIANQKDLLVKYANDNGFYIYDIYIDDGYSGTTFNRPSFLRMIKDIKKSNKRNC